MSDQDLTYSLDTLKSLSVKSVPEVVICDACATRRALNTVISIPIPSIHKKNKRQPETRNKLASRWMAEDSRVKGERNRVDK